MAAIHFIGKINTVLRNTNACTPPTPIDVWLGDKSKRSECTSVITVDKPFVLPSVVRAKVTAWFAKVTFVGDLQFTGKVEVWS